MNDDRQWENCFNVSATIPCDLNEAQSPSRADMDSGSIDNKVGKNETEF